MSVYGLLFNGRHVAGVIEVCDNQLVRVEEVGEGERNCLLCRLGEES